MDALDLLAEPARELLDLVDATLGRVGAPDDHPVWPLLRRLGALPGAAIGVITELRPAPLAAIGPSLRTLAAEYGQLSTAVPSELGWQGAAAEAFAAQWAALSAHLGGGATPALRNGAGAGTGGSALPHTGDGGDDLAARLAATAGYVEAVASWISRIRQALAGTLAAALASAEAVALVTGPAVAGWLADAITTPARPVPAHVVMAAADIAARVLDPIAQAYDEAEELLETWTARLVELPYRPPAQDTTPATTVASSTTVVPR
jgi:hypothetical protein